MTRVRRPGEDGQFKPTNHEMLGGVLMLLEEALDQLQAARIAVCDMDPDAAGMRRETTSKLIRRAGRTHAACIVGVQEAIRSFAAAREQLPALDVGPADVPGGI